MTRSEELSVLHWSLITCFFAAIFWGIVYYPKWTKITTEATLSHDVSGYYLYLPAAFIYKDIKQVSFLEEIHKKYHPSTHPGQVFKHEASGNNIMKYSMGQAFHFLPGFLIAHAVASLHPAYEADGFSKPYQYLIGISMFLYCLLGIYLMAHILSRYFSPTAAALSLVSIVLASNYLEYGAITNAMTHNTLFTNYCILIYVCIKFFESPKWKYALLIGLILGINTLTRPTEIIGFLIPLLWGINPFKESSLQNRILYLKRNNCKVLLAIIVFLFIGSLQLFYWKYVSGQWLVYSYEDQGFSWLNPHIVGALLSYKTGWLIYSPIMILGIIGIPFLIKQSHIWLAITVFCIVFTYLVCAWDLWTYGGSLGQRAMVQSYPLFAFPIAAFAEYLRRHKLIFSLLLGFVFLNIVYNFWWTHQAHKGGILKPGKMSKSYFWANLMVNDQDPETLKLLDTDEIFKGPRKDVRLIYNQQNDTLSNSTIQLDSDQEFSPAVIIDLGSPSKWLRIWSDVEIKEKEWENWSMTQLVGKFFKGEQEIKSNLIRVQRLMDPDSRKKIYFDISIPDEADVFKFYFWNPNEKKIWISNTSVEFFN